MTIKNLFLYTLAQWAIMTLLKLLFFNYDILANAGWQTILYWILAAAVAAACVRRFGILNYLEAFFLIVVWVLGDMLMDLLLTSVYTGLGIFETSAYWVGSLVFAFAVFFFHKKRHVHVRKLLQHSHHH